MATMIKINEWTDRKLSIAGAVSKELDGSDYDRGSFETVRATADNTAEAFGKLVEMLYRKHKIDDTDLKEFLGYGAKIVDE